MSLIEVGIALFLLTFSIMALISLQPAAWRLAGSSDFMGRAAGILQKQLQAAEARIMNPNSIIPTGTTIDNKVLASGQEAVQQGDAAFTVQTTTTDLGGGNSYRVSVRVTWPGSQTGITESLIVTRQEYYRQ